MAHPLDREFALPTTQQVLQSLGRLSQTGAIRRDSTHRPLKLVTGYSEARLRRFIADTDFAQPESETGVVERQ